MVMNSKRSKISYHKSKHWIIANTTIDTLKLNLYIKKLVQTIYHHFRRIHCNLKSRLNVNRERAIALFFYDASLILLTKHTLDTKGNITLLIKSSFANLSFVAYQHKQVQHHFYTLCEMVALFHLNLCVLSEWSL